ncbi:hypothetical protein G7B40_017260 [Aetokthonos hydrillicola Thurmond2011]|uniref:Uncharacterized protein n=1 Tax=Aetokthonos hydrillicola Thurmond2011 TaxID=2712845 RepID=A0AAP5IC06_9CYAN|nr:hypothetical protein [Aetokthonos hydrillicola Thurmond2011]
MTFDFPGEAAPSYNEKIPALVSRGIIQAFEQATYSLSTAAAPSSSSLFGGLCWNRLFMRPVVVRLRNFRAYAWFRSAFSFFGLRRLAMFTSLINNDVAVPRHHVSNI